MAVLIFYGYLDSSNDPNLKYEGLEPYTQVHQTLVLKYRVANVGMNFISVPQSDLVSCRGLVEAHRQDVEELKDQLEKGVEQEAELQEELASLRTEVTKLGSAEDTLQSKLSGRDRRIAHLEEKMADMQEARVRRLDAVGGMDTPCISALTVSFSIHQLQYTMSQLSILCLCFSISHLEFSILCLSFNMKCVSFCILWLSFSILWLSFSISHLGLSILCLNFSTKCIRFSIVWLRFSILCLRFSILCLTVSDSAWCSLAPQISDDVEKIREGLGVLRTGSAAEDAQHQTIDALERNIAELMGKLMERASSPSGRRGRRHVWFGDTISTVLLQCISYFIGVYTDSALLFKTFSTLPGVSHASCCPSDHTVDYAITLPRTCMCVRSPRVQWLASGLCTVPTSAVAC